MVKPPVILEVRDLSIQFDSEDGTVHAVNGISFQLSQGETLGIVGESGCGKSVSMLSLMKLLPEPPARIAGETVKFFNLNLLKLSKREMQEIRGSKIALIFQDPMTSLNPVLTVGFQLSEPLQLHMGLSKKQAYERAVELLQMVSIPDAATRLNDYPHQFSGGMRQRIMIAMALGCNPPLLIADEPTTALDVTIQAQIVDLVKGLRDQMDMSLIWITHDLGVVAGLVDRVIVMYAGYIVEEATVYDLYAYPSHPYTAALLASLPRIDKSSKEKLESIHGQPPDMIMPIHGCPFAARCTYVQDICRNQNPELREVSIGHWVACHFDLKFGEVQ